MEVTATNISDVLNKTEREEFGLALKTICKVLEDFNVQIKILKKDVEKLIENER